MNAKINLAPEVYQNGLRAKQRKRVATLIGTIVGGTALVVVGVAALVYGGQKIYLSTVNADIKKLQGELDSNADLIPAVTIQQHLKSVIGLYDQRVYLSQFLLNLQSISPVGVALESVQIDAANTVTISGTSASFNLASKFTKAIEADNIEIGANPDPSKTPYFTDISLLSADAGPTGKVAFKMTAKMASEVVAAPKSDNTGAYKGE